MFLTLMMALEILGIECNNLLEAKSILNKNQSIEQKSGKKYQHSPLIVCSTELRKAFTDGGAFRFSSCSCGFAPVQFG